MQLNSWHLVLDINHKIINKCLKVIFIIIASGSYSTIVASTEKTGLIAALQATIANNPALKGQQAELNAKNYGVDSAEAGRYPTLSVQVDNVNEDNETYATLRIDQPLWAFGKIDGAIDYASANVVVEQWGLLQVQRQLIEDTSAAYARIDGIIQRQQVIQVNITEHENLYQRIQRRQKGQLASLADVRLAYSRLLQANAQMMRVEGELSIAQVELQALTYAPVQTGIPVDLALVAVPCCEPIEQLAISQSADIRYKKQRVEVVKLGVTQEKLSYLPTLNLRAESHLFQSQDDIFIGLSIESRFDGMGMATKGRINSVKARLSAAQYDVDNALNDVRRQVSGLVLNQHSQQILMEAQGVTVTVVEETMQSFLRQYKAGRKSWVEVLNNQRELTEQRLSLAQIKNDWLVVTLRLATLIGVLDQPAGLKIDG
jgi:adhesin transport system outer membrane protein